jgi:crotonobetainyl-CoA:carnitine CoA-transferase CaiB-like acyl-CoA transferase
MNGNQTPVARNQGNQNPVARNQGNQNPVAPVAPVAPVPGHPSAHPALPVSHPTPPPIDGPGPLHGIRVIELSHEFGAFAGKLLADSGADVIVVEPPGGAAPRHRGATASGASDETIAAGEASLAWWADNTGKRSVVLDLDGSESDRIKLRELIGTADVVLECDDNGLLAALGLDHGRLLPTSPSLVWVSITPYGQHGPSAGNQMTDLTMLAGGGPMWSCGYDDHSLPPVRGGGHQGMRITGNHAVMAILTALVARPEHGGQHIDLSMHAAANVTTEFASYSWLVGRQIVQRQTGRHAAPAPTHSTQVRCSDGRYLNTGVPPRTPAEFEALQGWMVELELADDFSLFSVLALGAGYELLTLQLILEDPMAGEIFQAGREAVEFIATRLTAHEVFCGLQSRGIVAGVVWSPDETLQDPHFVERGYPTPLHHEQIGRDVVFAGAPIRLTGSPMRVARRAPMVGEHTDEVLGALKS